MQGVLLAATVGKPPTRGVRMFLTILEFAVVTLGVKLLLGSALIYYLLPADRRCSACDGDTLPLMAPRGLGRLGRVTRVERRLCLSCGATMVARRQPHALPRRRPAGEPRVERTAES